MSTEHLPKWTMETDAKFPYYFEKLSEADDAMVKSHFGSNSKVRDLGNVLYFLDVDVSTSTLVRVMSSETRQHIQTVTTRYLDHHKQVFNITLRPDVSKYSCTVRQISLKRPHKDYKNIIIGVDYHFLASFVI